MSLPSKLLQRPQAICRDRLRSSDSRKRRRRSFGEVRRLSTSRADDLTWPSGAHPTPHEILGTTIGQPYCKARFQELVKKYHPDLSRHNICREGLDVSARAERFRLVMSAHQLLSDVNKRLTYERYGIGWVFPRSSQPQHDFTPRDQGPFSYTTMWEQADGTHSDAPNVKRQAAVFASNTTFALILLALAMGGAIVQLERAKKAQWAMKLMDNRTQENLRIDLQDVADRLAGQPRDLRILAFLARRHLTTAMSGASSAGDSPDLFSGPALEENICRH